MRLPQAERIPKEIHQDIIEVVTRMLPFMPRVMRIEDLEYLFEVYNKYIEPYNKQTIECGACRSKVMSLFRQIVKIWTSEQNS